MSKPIKECKCQCGGGSGVTAKSLVAGGVCGSRSGDKLASKLKRKTIGIEYESDESKENHEDTSELVFDDDKTSSSTQIGCTCGAACASQDSFDRSANMLSGDDDDDDLPDHQKPQK